MRLYDLARLSCSIYFSITILRRITLCLGAIYYLIIALKTQPLPQVFCH